MCLCEFCDTEPKNQGDWYIMQRFEEDKRVCVCPEHVGILTPPFYKVKDPFVER